MKAIKKPVPIEVEEFIPSKQPWPQCVGKIDLTDHAVEYYVYNKLHDSRIKIQSGDYINVTDITGTDVYPIEAAVFRKTYTVIE